MANSVKISLVKQDGRIISNVQAIMKPTEMLIQDGGLPIEEGDTIECPLPNGLIDKFTVIDRGFNSFPKPHYQVKYTKISNAPAEQANITFNLQGTHSRVNIDSIDSSTNISSIDISTKFTEIQHAIENQILDSKLQANLLVKLEELNSAIGSQKYNTTFQEFIALAANVMSIIGPFIPFLSRLCGIQL